MNRLISIIVPIYKVEKWLNRCIESLVNQTYKNIEILLIDDGSPDRCPQICDDWGIKDSRIKVVHKQNGGLSDARNCGLKLAKGEYIFYVDSDDYINLDSVERFEAYADDEDLIIGEATVYSDDNILHRKHTNLQENYIYKGTEIATLAVKKGEWHAEACINMYRRDFLIDNNLFFTYGIFHEDNELQPRLFLKAEKIKYLQYEFYNYVLRSDSICGAANLKNRDDLYRIYESWVTLIKSIDDKTVYKTYSGALCKYYIHTCREFHDYATGYPDGITKRFLLKNALNFKELIKTICFVLFRKVYVKL